MSVMKTFFAAALSFMTLASVAAADDFKLVSNQRIACGRGLAPGKLNTATCKSYAYLFNAKTSEYARCQVTLALTRDIVAMADRYPSLRNAFQQSGKN